jgi:hypothetical protein
MTMVPVAWKLSLIEERRQTTVVCFEEKITETKATTMKKLLGSIPGEDGFCS